VYDPGKDYVRRFERKLRREALQRMDESGRPWEHQDNPLLRRYRNPARQLLIMLGIAAVSALIFVFLFLGFSPSTPQ
jgi:hypothetical protein